MASNHFPSVTVIFLLQPNMDFLIIRNNIHRKLEEGDSMEGRSKFTQKIRYFNKTNSHFLPTKLSKVFNLLRHLSISAAGSPEY